MSTEGVVIVTGASRGIGLEVARALCNAGRRVYLTARTPDRAATALAGCARAPVPHTLDVADVASVRAFADHLQNHNIGVDVIINNAGYNNDDPFPDYKTCKNIIDINFYGPRNIYKYLYPFLRDNARVINVSSDCGHLSNLKNEYWISRLKSPALKMSDIEEFVNWYLEAVRTGSFQAGKEMRDEGRYAAYRVSKIALSAASRVWAREEEERGGVRRVSVCSMHPGLVRTDMTRGAGFLSPAQAARTLLRLATQVATDDLNGAYFWHDGRPLDWTDHNADYYFKAATLLNK